MVANANDLKYNRLFSNLEMDVRMKEPQTTEKRLRMFYFWTGNPNDWVSISMPKTEMTLPLDELFDPRQKKAINHFISLVEHKAEVKMVITGKLEGSHYAAMKELQTEMNQ